MPDGGRIVCFYFGNDGPVSNVYDGNHNVFRLDKDGVVLWQITRIDKPVVDWELKHKRARESGLPGCIEPFTQFLVYRGDGSLVKELGPPDLPNESGFYEYWGLDKNNRVTRLVTREEPPRTEVLPDSVVWEPGFTVELFNLGVGTQIFTLDVETGVAVDITPDGQRPW